MTIREMIERNEEMTLSPYAVLSKNTKRLLVSMTQTASFVNRTSASFCTFNKCLRSTFLCLFATDRKNKKNYTNTTENHKRRI